MRKMVSGCVSLVLVVGLAACGGGSDDGSDAAGEDQTTASTNPDGDGGDPTDGTTDGTTDDSVDPRTALLDDDCQFLMAGAFLSPMTAAVPGADVDFEANAEQLAAIAKKAPEEIREDMGILAEGFAIFAEALQDVDLSNPQSFSDPAVLEKLEGIDDVIDERFEEASEAVGDYVEENCTG